MNSRSKPYLTAMLGIAFVLIASCAIPATSQAYRLSGGGGKLGYTNPENLDGTMTVGGQLEFENQSRLHLVPNVSYWKVDRVSDVNPNVDVYYHFSSQNRTSPYLGGGLGLNMRNSEITDRSSTALNANLIGGIRFPGGENHYFLEGRFTASEMNQVALVGGITFHTH